MRLLLTWVFLLSMSLDAAANDLYAVINQVRAGKGNCALPKPLPPLKRNAALERAARDLSKGRELEGSLTNAGYRSTRSRVISTRGDDVGAQAAAILARKNYCSRLQDEEMTEVGVYVDERQLWVVLAARLAVEMPREAAGERVLELVNQARAKARTCGRQAFKAARPLRWNEALAEASRLHAEDMARHNYFGHTGRDGSSPARRVERAGYRYRRTGENIAAGQTTPEDAVASWLESPRHCANLMEPAYTEMGVAFASDPRSEMGVYWVQAFGTPR